MRKFVVPILILAVILPPVYAEIVRYMLRQNMTRLRAGDLAPTLASYADDVRFVFPGESSFAGEFRGRDEVERWLRRFVGIGLQLVPQEILVSGPPWRTTVCVYFTDRLTDENGNIIYDNRGTLFGRIIWGKVVYYEVNEDTHKVAELDEYLTSRGL